MTTEQEDSGGDQVGDLQGQGSGSELQLHCV